MRLRNDFYERVCRRAKAEGDLPPDMAGFINLVVDSFDKKLFDWKYDKYLKLITKFEEIRVLKLPFKNYFFIKIIMKYS